MLEETDRRYAIFEMSSCHLNDHKYFKALADQCFNQDVADAFYMYLLDFDAVPLGKIIDTPLRTELTNLSKSTPLKFLDDAIEENMFEGETLIKASELYTKYRMWCENNGERNIYTSTRFGTALKDKINKKRTKSGMCYELLP